MNCFRKLLLTLPPALAPIRSAGYVIWCRIIIGSLDWALMPYFIPSLTFLIQPMEIGRFRSTYFSGSGLG